MAESLFAKRLKANLSVEIDKLITHTWGLNNFTVRYESTEGIEGRFDGRPDLTIVSNDDIKKPIGIEIEHISEYAQSIKNIKKFRNWAHQSQYRNCGLLHIFNNDCRISRNNLCKIVEYGKTNEQKLSGFYYDTYFYYVFDNRETKQISIQIATSAEFEIRLWDLLRCVGLVKN